MAASGFVGRMLVTMIQFPTRMDDQTIALGDKLGVAEKARTGLRSPSIITIKIGVDGETSTIYSV